MAKASFSGTHTQRITKTHLYSSKEQHPLYTTWGYLQQRSRLDKAGPVSATSSKYWGGVPMPTWSNIGQGHDDMAWRHCHHESHHMSSLYDEADLGWLETMEQSETYFETSHLLILLIFHRSSPNLRRGKRTMVLQGGASCLKAQLQTDESGNHPRWSKHIQLLTYPL